MTNAITIIKSDTIRLPYCFYRYLAKLYSIGYTLNVRQPFTLRTVNNKVALVRTKESKIARIENAGFSMLGCMSQIVAFAGLPSIWQATRNRHKTKNTEMSPGK